MTKEQKDELTTVQTTRWMLSYSHSLDFQYHSKIPVFPTSGLIEAATVMAADNSASRERQTSSNLGLGLGGSVVPCSKETHPIAICMENSRI